MQGWSSGDSGYQGVLGNRGAWIFHREAGDRTGIMATSLWESEKAIRRLVAEDIDFAAFCPSPGRGLVARAPVVSRYRVMESARTRSLPSYGWFQLGGTFAASLSLNRDKAPTHPSPCRSWIPGSTAARVLLPVARCTWGCQISP